MYNQICIEILEQAHNLNKPTRALNCLNTKNAGRSITRQRGVSNRTVFSGVRIDKGVCGAAGESSDKLLCTLPCYASTIIAVGRSASILSHQCGGVGTKTAKSGEDCSLPGSREEPPPSSSKVGVVGEGGGGVGGGGGDS